MRSLFEVSGGFPSLHRGCLERFTPRGERWKCLFPEYFTDLLLYDSSELTYTLGLGCCAAGGACGSGYTPCSGHDMLLVQSLHENHSKALEAMAHKNGSG